MHLDLPLERLSIQSPERSSDQGEGSLEADETRGRSTVKEGTSGRRPRSIIDMQKAEISKLQTSKEEYWRKYKAAEEHVVKLEDDIEDMSRVYQETAEAQARRIQVLEDDLARTKELLAERTTELSGAQSFLSTTDRLSEADVLGIVRDLNENIFQVAANLCEEWEKFRPDRSSRFKISDEDIDGLSQTFGPALVRQVLKRDPAALNFLVQSCLCDHAASISSSWRCKREFKTLISVYDRLSDSEGQAISARWRSLAHSHLSEPPSDSALIVRSVSKVLWMTGSFPSFRHSLDFVNEKAFNGITTIESLALRLESVFMRDILSCDTCLLYESPWSVFDSKRMTREVESDGGSTPRGHDKVAGTTEVGLEKSVSLGRGKGRRRQMLLKTKVVLDEDLAEL